MQVISDENQSTDPTARALRWLVTALAITMSLYHMYVAGFGPPEAVIFRGIHLMFALALVFLLYPLSRSGLVWRGSDLLLMGLGLAAVLHILLDYQTFVNRIIYIDDLTTLDMFFAITMILVVLEGTRRVIGWALPLTAVVSVIYAAAFTQVKFPVLMEQLYLSTEGIFGSTLGVSASYVMLFVIFGAFMEKSGTGQLFMDFALSITGGSAGGPGKVAVELLPVWHGVRKCGGQCHGRWTDHHSADEAFGLSAVFCRGGGVGGFYRRAVDATRDGGSRIRDG